MNKGIALAYGGTPSEAGGFAIRRLVPNRYVETVGSFTLLDHLLPVKIAPGSPGAEAGGAHPHRGIATFTYLFSGEVEHLDSRGHHGVVGAGGIQWMNAGNGIVHDENPSPRFREQGGLLHGLQFWINLPAAVKAGAPAYLALPAGKVPEAELPGGAGQLRVLIGAYGDRVSPVPSFSRQFIYHIRLHAGAAFDFAAPLATELAAFLPLAGLIINDQEQVAGELVVFGVEGHQVTFRNDGPATAELILFGGEAYTEPIVAEGPFVMNSKLEIAQAYRDYLNGRYGTIRH